MKCPWYTPNGKSIDIKTFIPRLRWGKYAPMWHWALITDSFGTAITYGINNILVAHTREVEMNMFNSRKNVLLAMIKK